MKRELLGNQTATTRLVPRGRGDDSAVKLAELIDFDLLPWQREVLTDSAQGGRDGRWRTFENVLMAPRQVGKSFVVVPRALAGCLIFGERLVVYSAHNYRTAQETWLLMSQAVRHEAIAPFVARIYETRGRESVTFTNGARFTIQARTKHAGRGFSPDCLLFDESFALTGDMVSAWLPTVSARPNPQIYYFSTAGSYQSEILLGLRKRGHNKRSAKLGYWEWHADPTVDHRDEKVWRATNPSYGILQTRDSVERELESMSEKSFRRERLGIWSESYAETAMSEDDLDAVVVEVPSPPSDGRPIRWGVAAQADRSTAAITACFRNDDGRPVVVLVQSGPGAGWLVDRLGEINELYPGAVFAYDARGNVVDLMDRAYRVHGVEGYPLKYSDYPAACANFVQAVSDQRIRIGRAPELVRDATNATSKTLPSGWSWNLAVHTPPIRLVAATCALWALERDEGGVAVY